jgi:hypothetical protein
MALVDLNADGVTDLVLAGPAEQHSQIGIGDGKSFDIRELPDEAEVEVLGVLALDVDADGDEDLYLSCSGVSQAGAPGISVACVFRLNSDTIPMNSDTPSKTPFR